MKRRNQMTLTRRDLLRLSMMAGAATLIGSRIIRTSPAWAQTCAPAINEVYPTSPLILNPFTDPLPIPRALAPVAPSVVATWPSPPGPNNQDSTGKSHQIWPSQLGLRPPKVYRIKLQVNDHAFTSSQVLPIDSSGLPSVSFDAAGNTYPAGTQRTLPKSTIYGFNGSMPGPMINAEYGQPVLIRFENELHLNPKGLDRNDFGSPEWGFLTHLHNGHTAPESDGNPNYTENVLGQAGYLPEQWVDNLYLLYPAGNDPAEKQSMLWFHDHFMHFTGANVYKGMLGLMPHYDPGFDDGDETNRRGLRLPGVRTNEPDGCFDVDYDIPLALYDCGLDDGVTPHQDLHNGCGETHPEWWGQTFFRHFPNHGFMGDVFTINGVAYPVLEVKRRKYRLRFLGASMARCYKLSLMSSSTAPVTAASQGFSGERLHGQWRLPNGQQCMRMTQIASEGGLLPFPIVRDNFELWPAKRREVVVDFTQYMDGSPTRKGDVIYLVNTKEMRDGRKPDAEVDEADDPAFRVPMMKIVIGDDAPDNSVMPRPNRPLRKMPLIPSSFAGLTTRTFELERTGTFGDENMWVINGVPFDPLQPLASPRKGSAEIWNIINGGGGWTHPMHIHQEEHRVISRNGVPAPGPFHPDDTGKEDVVALEPGEEVTIYRKFRTFTGKYVAHCHNLAHEDHNMMFGWEIIP